MATSVAFGRDEVHDLTVAGRQCGIAFRAASSSLGLLAMMRGGKVARTVAAIVASQLVKRGDFPMAINFC